MQNCWWARNPKWFFHLNHGFLQSCLGCRHQTHQQPLKREKGWRRLLISIQIRAGWRISQGRTWVKPQLHTEFLDLERAGFCSQNLAAASYLWWAAALDQNIGSSCLWTKSSWWRWFSQLFVSDFCNPMDYSPPGCSVHGISQARVLEWGVIPFSRGSSPPRDQTQVSRIAGGFFTTEPPGKPKTS